MHEVVLPWVTPLIKNGHSCDWGKSSLPVVVFTCFAFDQMQLKELLLQPGRGDFLVSYSRPSPPWQYAMEGTTDTREPRVHSRAEGVAGWTVAFSCPCRQREKERERERERYIYIYTYIHTYIHTHIYRVSCLQFFDSNPPATKWFKTTQAYDGIRRLAIRTLLEPAGVWKDWFCAAEYVIHLQTQSSICSRSPIGAVVWTVR